MSFIQAGIDDGTYSEAGFTITSLETATPSPPTGGLSTGAVVGIVIAAVAGTILVVVLITACVFIYMWCVICLKAHSVKVVMTVHFLTLTVAYAGPHERARKANTTL